MTPVVFRAPLDSDLRHIAEHMRAIDALECTLTVERSPYEALLQSVEHSDWCEVALVDDQPQCVFGAATLHESLLGDDGAPWMLGAQSMCRHAKALLIHSRPKVEAMRWRYQRLFNIVHAHNRASIRWLKWLGFSFGDEVKVKGHPFLQFEMAGHV